METLLLAVTSAGDMVIHWPSGYWNGSPQTKNYPPLTKRNPLVN